MGEWLMNQLLTAIITTACTVAVSLVVTYIFNKVSGVPKKIAEEKKAHEDRIAAIEETAETNKTEVLAEINTVKTELTQNFDAFASSITSRLEDVEEAVSHYPEYRSQSLQIQQQLQQADVSILEACTAIKNDVTANRNMLDTRLKSLENREKNALREKIYHLWRTFTDPYLNPLQAWTDMELHSFYELVKDYESLGGNDYVHKVILPAMTRLRVISMEDLNAVKDLFESRNAKKYCSDKNND
jgi:hypothetical protein